MEDCLVWRSAQGHPCDLGYKYAEKILPGKDILGETLIMGDPVFG
jgi:hypothetical protein